MKGTAFCNPAPEQGSQNERELLENADMGYKERYKEAEGIEEILLAIFTNQRSGLLSIEHMQGGSREKGEIYLLSGEPMYARTTKLSGQAALTYLLAWHPIRYAFISDAPRPPANLSSRVNVPSLFAPPKASLALPQQVSPVGAQIDRSENQWLPPRRRIEMQQSPLLQSLTRRQRLLYFLIDGQRTIADLSRCSGKTPQEVESILRELYQLGLINFPASG